MAAKLCLVYLVLRQQFENTKGFWDIQGYFDFTFCPKFEDILVFLVFWICGFVLLTIERVNYLMKYTQSSKYWQY